MKWLFLVNNADYLFEFLGKVGSQLVKEQDECLLAVNSKIAEYEKSKFFPKEARIISKVDWCIKNYDPARQEFGELSWRELYTIYERFNLYKYDYKKCLNIAGQLFQFFDFIFKNEKPDAVIGEVPAGFFGLAAYYFCKKNNIPFYEVAESRISGRIDIHDCEWTCSKYEKTFKSLTNQDILPEESAFTKSFIDNFISHKIIYSSYYLGKIKFNFITFAIHYYKRVKQLGKVFLRYALDRKKFAEFDYESESILLHSIASPFRTIKRNFKILFEKNIFDKFNPKEKYFFFPLQFEPEASTLVLATFYSNQLATIKNVAITLPFPYKLYLKEHPGSIGARKKDFYKEIKKIPNAVLLSSKEHVPEIIDGSSGVIVMTSTVGMEAALSGKPVYILGNVFYSYHPMCKKVGNFQNLKEKIKQDLKINQKIEDLGQQNERFIVSYLRNGIEANIFTASVGKDENNYKKIYQDLKNFNK